jgi:serine/threonine protein phosphatase PrpC
MKFCIYQESRTGARQANQDRVSYSYSREALLMVIADGMGGHLHGEVAAQISVQYITEIFQHEATPRIKDPALFLSKALLNAHHAILDYAGDRLLKDAPRTTCVACIVQDGAAFWAHAGDSRLYLIRNGKIAAQTRDHSRVRMMVDDGLISEAEAANHPSRNRIYSCLGGPASPLIEFSPRTSLRGGDILALCTDGAWGPLGDARLAQSLSEASVMESVPGLLGVAEGLAGDQCDNLSMIAMRWEDDLGATTAGAVSTQTLPLEGFTTQMEEFGRSRTGGGGTGADLTDEEIEQAIREIQAAIHKYSK